MNMTQKRAALLENLIGCRRATLSIPTLQICLVAEWDSLVSEQ
jgi:hypothetical protein